jgi:hypothetical protein
MDISDLAWDILKLAEYYFTNEKLFLIKKDNENITLLDTHMPLTNSLLIGRLCFSLFAFFL